MSRVRAAQRQGLLEKLKWIYAYVIRTKDYATRLRVMEPDYSYLHEQSLDWTHTVYGHVQEIIPQDIPDPFRKIVTTTVDANLNHCLATGRYLTGCLHFVNHTPIDPYSKRQTTVEPATYRSEIVASKTATEQIIDLRHTLRYLGVPIKNLIFWKPQVCGDQFHTSTLNIRKKDIIFVPTIKLGKQLHQRALLIIGFIQDTILVTC